MSTTRVCVLGAGNMGRALISGLLRSGTRAEEIQVGESVPAARELLARELGITASPDNETALAGANVVLLAVKPQDAAAVLAPLAKPLAVARPLLVSVMRRHPGARSGGCQRGLAVVRAMPNRPALVGAGISGLYAPRRVPAGPRAAAEAILESVGEVVWVPTEDALDVVTALSGSGPAYFFLLAECMAEAGAQLGLEHAVAQRLAIATLHGSGLLAHTPGRRSDPPARRGHLARRHHRCGGANARERRAARPHQPRTGGRRGARPGTGRAAKRRRKRNSHERASSTSSTRCSSLALFVVLARLLLQLARADFRNPLCQAIVKVTNPLILPLRRILPPVGKVDTRLGGGGAAGGGAARGGDALNGRASGRRSSARACTGSCGRARSPVRSSTRCCGPTSTRSSCTRS